MSRGLEDPRKIRAKCAEPDRSDGEKVEKRQDLIEAAPECDRDSGGVHFSRESRFIKICIDAGARPGRNEISLGR